MATNVENFNLEEGFAIPENMELSETTETLDDVELSKTRKIIETGGDTSKIKMLSPELARLLLEKNEGKDVVIDLKGLKTLDTMTAGVLSQFKGKQMLLSDDINLDDDVLFVLLPVKSKLNIIEKLNKLEMRINISDKMNSKMKIFQEGIERTNKDLDWKNDRGDIKYDWRTSEISSWGKSVEVEEITENSIRLKGLYLDLTWEEGIWLANYKNRLKHEDRESISIVSDSFKHGFSKDSKYLFFESNSSKVGRRTADTKEGELDKFLPNCAKDPDKLKEIVRWLNNKKSANTI